MKFAFIIFKYFPFGGMQRDMLRTARHLVEMGHDIDIYALSWEGERPEPEIKVHVIPTRSWLNYRKYRKFISLVQRRLQQDSTVDFVFGYNRLPGIDGYYAADPCFVERARLRHPPIYRLTPRYRWFAAVERAIFSADSLCEILMVSQTEMPLFQHWYGTQAERMHYIPPFLSAERLALRDRTEMRAYLREAFGLAYDSKVALLVGSGFATKGLDRAIRAMAALPDDVRRGFRLIAVGQDNPTPFLRLAKQLGVQEHLIISKGRPDIPWLMQGADFQVHPAYRENTGLVILEGLASGLPLLVTDTCGYAHHVLEADAGLVVPSPFDQAQFNHLFAGMMTSPRLDEWRRNGIAHARAVMQQNDGRAEARLLIELAARKLERERTGNAAPSA